MKKFFIAILCLVSSAFSQIDLANCKTEMKVIAGLVGNVDGGFLTQTLHDDFWSCFDYISEYQTEIDISKEQTAVINKFPYMQEYFLSLLETYKARKKIIRKEFKMLLKDIENYKGLNPNLYDTNVNYRQYINGIRSGFLNQASMDIFDKVARREPVFSPIYNQEIIFDENTINEILKNLNASNTRMKNLFDKNYKMDTNNREVVSIDDNLKILTQVYSYQEIVKKLAAGEDIEKLLYAATEIVKKRKNNPK